MPFLDKIGALLGKNPIESIADIADRFIRTKEDKDEFQKEMLELRHKIDMADKELELTNVMDARQREAKVKASGSKDIMMTITGSIALAAGVGVIVFAFVGPDMTQIQERIFYFVAGASFGWVGSVVNYYFGSSKGSKDKSNELQDIIRTKQ